MNEWDHKQSNNRRHFEFRFARVFISKWIQSNEKCVNWFSSLFLFLGRFWVRRHSDEASNRLANGENKKNTKNRTTMANHCHALALKCLRNAQIVIDFMCESEKRNSLHVRQFGLMYRIKKSLFCRRHRRHHLRHHRRCRCCLRRHVVCDQRKRLPVVNQFNIIFPSSFLLLLLLLKSSWSPSSLLAAVIAARAHSINKLNKCIYLVLFLEHISTHGILCTQELTAMAKGKAIRHSAVDTNFFNERRLYNSR